MENLLRNCYDEMKIRGVNELIYEKRANAITEILDGEFLAWEEYRSITYWLMGLNEKPEDILIKLERQFCQHDDSFTLQGTQFQGEGNKEIEVLCTVLLFKYCDKEKDYELPITILCGKKVGYKLKSRKIIEKFENMVDEYRIILREEKELSPVKKMASFVNTRKKLNEAINDGSTYSLEVTEQKEALEQIEICQKNIKILEENEKKYRDNMRARSEETNLLWWMIAEWSECYKKLYRNMTVMEAALTVPIDLYDLIEFELYPYATEQIILKILSVTKDFTEEEYSLQDMIRAVGKELVDNANLQFDKSKVDGRIQPILYALKIKGEVEKEEDWSTMFRIGTKCEMGEISMSPMKFSLQLCKELELHGYSEDEE